MRFNQFTLAFCCALGSASFSVHALQTCPATQRAANSPVVAPDPAATIEVNQVARRLAGLAPPADLASPAIVPYLEAANAGWKAYARDYGTPLAAWAARQVRPGSAQTVFYPFSGPDLPSMLAVFPGSVHYVMVSDQYANGYFDPFALKDPQLTRVLEDLGKAWISFGERGFFVTTELNQRGGGERKLQLTPTMILMAYAARLGYEIRTIRPICLDADLTLRALEARSGARWDSVRLDLRKAERDIIIDYVKQDLSDRGLQKRADARAFIESVARGPVLLKAASHLPQMPAFSIIRDAILNGAPLVVQDETGLEYDTLAARFHVALHGEYVGAHRLFKEATNPSLIKAYAERAKEVRPLGFPLGYRKEAGAAIQVAVRK